MSQQLSTSSGRRWKSLKKLLRRTGSVHIIVDGPNFLRKVGNKPIKLEDIDEMVEGLGEIGNKIVVLNTQASDRLVQAVVNSGYTPIISTTDLHVKISMLALELSHKNPNDIIAIGSRDAKLTTVMMKLKERGTKTAIIGFDPGFSIALKNIADYALEIM